MIEAPSINNVRNHFPSGAERLHRWVSLFTGINIARQRVCVGHDSPFDAFSHQVLERPAQSLWLGNRGGGKSFLSALDTHVVSRFHRDSPTVILGGSLAQSEQIYLALKRVHSFKGHGFGTDGDAIKSLLARRARYQNGSTVSILACSEHSTRGPHVPSLKLDEVDDIPEERFDAAMGMLMNIDESVLSPSVLMSSTWHRAAGLMAKLLAKAEAGKFRAFKWCVFEVLERCSDQRSGRWVGGHDAYENCPMCPIRIPCHSDRGSHHPLPKAKRSNGHYSIDSLIQKIDTVSKATFNSDYECKGPKSAGLYFPEFSTDRNRTEAAEFNPIHPVYESIDSGVWSGCVWFQTFAFVDEISERYIVNIFAEYISEDRGVRGVGQDILRIRNDRCQGKRTRSFTDPAGSHRNAVGPVVISEFKAVGLDNLEHWPSYDGSVKDGLALIDSFIKTADDRVSFFVHPRCTQTIAAFQSYIKASSGGQYTERPKDPQHPHEEIIDSIRGGLLMVYPQGVKPPTRYFMVPAGKVF